MANGLRRSAFDQSSYDYWAGKYGVVNVKDFGAVGDGVHDDTAAIQAALKYASGINNSVVVFNGVFRTTETLSMSSKISNFSISLIGYVAGRNSNSVVGGSYIQNTNTGYVLAITGSSQNALNTVKLSDLSLLGPTPNNTAYVGDALYISNVQNLICDNVVLAQAANGLFYSGGDTLIANNLRCIKSGSNGALISAVSNLYIINSWFSGNSAYGINASGVDYDFELTQVQCNGNGGYGLGASSCSFILTRGLILDSNNPGTSLDQAYLSGCNYINLNSTWVAATANNTGRGIHLNDCNEIVVESSMFVGVTGGAALLVVGQTSANTNSDFVFSGNYVENCQTVVQTVNYGGSGIVQGNYADGASITGSQALNLSGSFVDYNIKGNTLKNFLNASVPASNWLASGNIGINPVGSITPPASPLVSGTVYQNTYGVDITIYQPAYATTAGTAGSVAKALGATSTPATIATEYVSGATTSTLTHASFLRVPAGWYFSFTASGTTLAAANIQGE